jgi:hypothetical protein
MRTRTRALSLFGPAGLRRVMDASPSSMAACYWADRSNRAGASTSAVTNLCCTHDVITRFPGAGAGQADQTQSSAAPQGGLAGHTKRQRHAKGLDKRGPLNPCLLAMGGLGGSTGGGGRGGQWAKTALTGREPRRGTEAGRPASKRGERGARRPGGRDGARGGRGCGGVSQTPPARGVGSARGAGGAGATVPGPPPRSVLRAGAGWAVARPPH